MTFWAIRLRSSASAAAVFPPPTTATFFPISGIFPQFTSRRKSIPLITPELFEHYKADGTISGGMLPKIENAINALNAGVKKVVITLASAINGTDGTVIKL